MNTRHRPPVSDQDLQAWHEVDTRDTRDASDTAPAPASTADTPPLSLPLHGDLNIYAVDTLKPELLKRLDGATTVELDLQYVTEIDTAGMQLLLLLKHTALRHGKQLRLVRHSQAAADTIQFLGLGDFFGDPLPIQAQWS